MKILGEKSLSSKVIIGLQILFGVITTIDIIVLQIIIKNIKHICKNENVQNNVSELGMFSILIITGIIALFIIAQFIQIFKGLKKNELFSQNNVKRLNIISTSCFAMSGIYTILAILIFTIMRNIIQEFMMYIFCFSLAFSIIFLIGGVGLKILNEIYKKAIEYKEENDFTI